MQQPFFAVVSVTLLFQIHTLACFSQSASPVKGNGVTSTSLWSVMENPAGLAGEDHFSAGFYYQSAFLMHELADAGFALSLPVKSFSVFGLGYHRFGYELYREELGTVAISKSLSKNVDAGVRFDYLRIAFGNGYGNAGAFTGSAGVMVMLTQELKASVDLFNPWRARMKTDAVVRYPARMRAALTWSPGTHVELSLGISKTGTQQSILACSADYRVSGRFRLRTGVSNGSSPFFFGYAFRIGSVETEMVSGYHQLLGFSPQISFIYKKATK